MSTIVEKSICEVTDLLLCCCWSHLVALIWDQGGGILDMGVTCRVVGFRTGVWNFVGARLGFDLGLLDRSFLFGILGCFGQSLFGYVQFQGVIVVSFPCCPSFLFFCYFFGHVKPQGVCWDIPALLSLTTPQQIDKNTNCTVHMSCPVSTTPFIMSFIWYSGPQFTQEHCL